MSRRFAALFVLTGLSFAPFAMADDTPPAPAETAPAPVETAPAPAEAPVPASAAPAATATESTIAVPNDRLPLAKPKSFIERHPVTMPTVTAPKVDWKKYKPTSGFAGFGIMNDMLHAHGDVATGIGHFYLRMGRFMDTDQGSAINGGWRTPIGTDDMNKDGYFAGVFAGQIIGDSFLGKKYNRKGIGADMGYQWVNEHTLKVLSVGIGFGEPDKINGVTKQAKPVAFFSYAVDLRVF